jgi:AcrR family transcriptional regulator
MPIRSSTSRRERAREHARRDILLACAEVFARRGFAAATLAELAEAAGFAAPSLYRYFESKEQIFRSLVEMLVREMEATFVEPVDRALPLGARIEALLRAQFRIAESHRSALAVLHDAGPELAAGTGLDSPHAGLAFYEARVREWLKRNASRAELRHPPEVVSRAVAGMVFAFGRCADAAGPVGRRIQLVVDLVLNGVAAPASRRRGAHA